MANPGQEGGFYNVGGAGYSGGGQWDYDGAYSGGYDGSEGGGSQGGSGTHEDISEYIFTKWKLTPGDGGSHYDYYGGGGGGVMVDGSGPGTVEYKGQGYGGGGNGITMSGYEIGLPGLVLLEISSG